MKNLQVLNRDELTRQAVELRSQLPKKVFPIEPPENDKNRGYWKWCPVCKHRFLFPGYGYGPATGFCELCGSQIIWNEDEELQEPDLERMSTDSIRRYIAEIRERIPPKVSLVESKLSRYYMACPRETCKNQHVSPGSPYYPNAGFCNRCGASVAWPTDRIRYKED